jgi:hypothetical protein
LLIGSQKNTRKTPIIRLKGFQMAFQSIELGCGSTFSTSEDCSMLALCSVTAANSLIFEFPFLFVTNAESIKFRL